MPENIGDFELFDMLEYHIKDRLKHTSKVSLGDNWFKMGNEVVSYWYEKNGEILLAAEFDVKPQSYVVNSVGKKYKGSMPYASDLYNRVLKDTHKSIRIMSDVQLSNEGFSIWERLIDQGHSISVYNKNEPGRSFKILNKNDLKKYHQADTDFRKYQFIISESSYINETAAVFGTRRMRELTGRI